MIDPAPPPYPEQCASIFRCTTQRGQPVGPLIGRSVDPSVTWFLLHILKTALFLTALRPARTPLRHFRPSASPAIMHENWSLVGVVVQAPDPADRSDRVGLLLIPLMPLLLLLLLLLQLLLYLLQLLLQQLNTPAAATSVPPPQLLLLLLLLLLGCCRVRNNFQFFSPMFLSLVLLCHHSQERWFGGSRRGQPSARAPRKASAPASNMRHSTHRTHQA